MQINTFPIVLENVYSLSKQVKHFVFKTASGQPFHFLPGQFITVHFEKDGQSIKRSYSLANPPEGNSSLEFAAGYVEGGPGTEFLFQLKPGDTIQVNGPFGRLVLKEETPKRYVLVATSTGVTPYRSMIPQLTQLMEASPELEVILMQGVQFSEDVLYRDDFEAFSKMNDRVQLRFQLSRQPQESLTSFEYTGYVQHAFESLALNPVTDVVYLCGNPGMIDEAFAYLKSLNFPMSQIVREKYISR